MTSPDKSLDLAKTLQKKNTLDQEKEEKQKNTQN